MIRSKGPFIDLPPTIGLMPRIRPLVFARAENDDFRFFYRLYNAWSWKRHACTLVAYIFHIILELSLDKILLKIQESRRSLDLGSHHLVSHRQDLYLHTQEHSNLLSQLGLAESLLEKCCSEKVRREIPVAYSKPRFRGITFELSHAVVGVPCDTVPLLLVNNTRERVSDNVNVGANVHTKIIKVVSSVDDRSHFFRRIYLGKAIEEACCAYPACEADY